MVRSSLRRARGVVLATAAALMAGGALASAALGADTRVTVGSPAGPFSQNKQNEPAVAIDAHDPNVVAAGSNDNIDMEACAAGDPTTCPFTPGVGVSGIYFSFTGGRTWIQPTYHGLTARDCLGPAACTPHPGPIGTLPDYYEAGLQSDGDPAVAFGPRPDASGHFSWDNGSRLYYANLTANIADTKKGATFRGFEAIAVSYADDLRRAATGDNSAWSPPVIVSEQSSTTFSDKEQIWADNAATSRYFGHVYVCWANFRSDSAGNGLPVPINFASSADGGNTWRVKQISSATVNPNNPGRDGCTVRTDSRGRVYVFYRGVASNGGPEAQLEVRSDNGGQTFERPHAVAGPAGTVGVLDPLILRPVMDGDAGARADLSPAPSVDIANGAPSGTDATDEIVMAWVDGSPGLDNERGLLAYSTNRGDSFSGPVRWDRALATQASDRPFYAAPGVSPNGRDLYLTYNAFTAPYRDTTATPRPLTGVVLHADLNPATGAPAGWTELNRGTTGDARSSSQNNLVAEFLGDYVYTAATRSFGVGVWNDVRNGADCPAIDRYRQAYETAVRAGEVPPVAQEDSPAAEDEGDAPPRGPSGTPPAAPNVQGQCPAAFGNSDIYGGHYDDPTP